MKQPISLRITKAAHDMLKELAQSKGISQSAVLEIAVREAAGVLETQIFAKPWPNLPDLQSERETPMLRRDPVEPKHEPKSKSKPILKIPLKPTTYEQLLSYVTEGHSQTNTPHPCPWRKHLKNPAEEIELRAYLEEAWPTLLKLWLDTYGTNPVPSERLFFLLFEKPNYPPNHDPEQDPEVELQIFCDVLARHLMHTYTIDENHYQQKFGGQSTSEGVTYTLALIPKAIK